MDDWTVECHFGTVIALIKEMMLVLSICNEWREIVLNNPSLWPVVASVDRKVFGLFRKRNSEFVGTFPGDSRPLMVYMDRSGPQDNVLNAILLHAPSTQPIFICVEDAGTAHQVYRLAQKYKTCLKVLSTGNLEDDKILEITGNLPHLEVLALHRCAKSRDLSCIHLRILRICCVDLQTVLC